MTKVRQKLADAGLIPMVDVKYVPSYEHLPYTNELITVMVINEPGLKGQAVPESEIIRTVFFDRPVVRGGNGSWKVAHTAMPSDVDEWTHMLHGPNNIPYSQDHRVDPWVTGLRFTVGDMMNGARQNRLATISTRLAGGRMFVLGTNPKDSKETLFRVVDAANGLPLWSRPASDLDFRRNTRVVSDTDVIGYFNAQGPMLRLDAASGEELLAYDNGLHLEYGEYLGGGKEFGARTKKLLAPFIKNPLRF